MSRWLMAVNMNAAYIIVNCVTDTVLLRPSVAGKLTDIVL